MNAPPQVGLNGSTRLLPLTQCVFYPRPTQHDFLTFLTVEAASAEALQSMP
jgi:hypothetical protein